MLEYTTVRIKTELIFGAKRINDQFESQTSLTLTLPVTNGLTVVVSYGGYPSQDHGFKLLVSYINHTIYVNYPNYRISLPYHASILLNYTWHWFIQLINL